MRKNEAYWAKRAARRVDLMEEDLLRYENELAAIYRQASVRIQADVRELLKRFSNRYGLSEQEALAMLDKPISPQEIAMLKMRLPMVQDEALKKAMQARLEAQAYGYRMSRKEALGMDLQMHAQDIAGRSNTVISKALVNVAQSNDKRLLSDMAQQFKSKGINISPSFSLFSQGYIESLTRQRWYGKDFSQRVWDNTQRLAQKMNTAVMDDLVAGRSNARVAKTLQEEMGSGYKEAIRLVRTESNRVCNSADIERYKSLGIKYYKILATKDSRTSARCRKEDGNYYLVEEAETGKTLPPFHPNCRSTTHSVVKKKEIIEAMKARGELEIAQEGLPEGKKGLPEPPRGLPDGNYPEKPVSSNSSFGKHTSTIGARMELKSEVTANKNPYEVMSVHKGYGEQFISPQYPMSVSKANLVERRIPDMPLSVVNVNGEGKTTFEKPPEGVIVPKPWPNEKVVRAYQYRADIKKIIEDYYGELPTDYIVLTDEKERHILEDHSDAADLFFSNTKNLIVNPQIITKNSPQHKYSILLFSTFDSEHYLRTAIQLPYNKEYYKINYISTSHIMGVDKVIKELEKLEILHQEINLLGTDFYKSKGLPKRKK